MDTGFRARRGRRIQLLSLAACVLLPGASGAQTLTGSLIGTVKDEQGRAIVGARGTLSSPALLGGPSTVSANEKGQLRFLVLPPGTYTLDILSSGFTAVHEEGISIGASATVERDVVLRVAGVAESVVVGGPGSRIDVRANGFATRFGQDDIGSIPTRRSSMFDALRATPGISPTSPSSGTNTTMSAFGSATNENQFLIDGTNFTCPCNGVARSEPGVDFIQEVQVQSAGASAEFGNVQGAVVNVIMRQGGNRMLFDAGYYAQSDAMTSEPIRLPIPGSDGLSAGYKRAQYHDLAANLGGPLVRNRLWFFAGYEGLRDSDSQPGSDPAFPRAFEQKKAILKLTWRLTPGWQVMNSIHDDRWVSPEQPTRAKPFDATVRTTASIPAITFAQVTHTMSPNTVWEARAGRFVFSQHGTPADGDATTPSRSDTVTGVVSGAPPQFGDLTLARSTAKAAITHYRSGLLGADHEWKAGGQFEVGEHHSTTIIPTGVRYVDENGQHVQAISSLPSNTGGKFVTASAFAMDTLTVGDRLTISAGLRFDRARAISQDLHAVDLDGNETTATVQGLGTLYTWNLWSPRLGATMKLGADGRTMLRGSFGLFRQGILTGELGPFHPGASAVTTVDLRTGAVRTVDSHNLRLDAETTPPRSAEFSVGLDREVTGRLSVAVAYIRKDGSNFIGWSDVAGQYHEESRSLPDGSTVPVFVLDSRAADRVYLLTNQRDYSLTYNGIVMAAEKRRSSGWQAFGSYTFSRTSGLLPFNGTTAPQVSTVAPPPGPSLTFGRDPNDLTNAAGRLANDRPHIFRLRGSVDVWRTGFVFAGSLQYFTGKPWAATAQVALPQNNQQRVQLEPRGARRLSSQTLLDLRLSRRLPLGSAGRLELLVDVLNVLNDTAEEAVVTDNRYSPSFGQPSVFIDPRRAMLGMRLNLGR